MTVSEYIKKNYPNAAAGEILEDINKCDIGDLLDKNAMQLTLAELVDLAALLEVHVTELVLDLV